VYFKVCFIGFTPDYSLGLPEYESMKIKYYAILITFGHRYKSLGGVISEMNLFEENS
jgi:hypothetical protein